MVDNEDIILSFILNVSKANADDKRFNSLFSFCYLEYCSAEKCKEFISFVKGKAEMKEMGDIISCIERRLCQESLPMNPFYIEGRHIPLNGMLRRERKRDNVLLEASSIIPPDDIYWLLGDGSKELRTEFMENAYVNISLKDGKSFTIQSYTIRGRIHDDCCNLMNWRFEGQNALNNEWILLDTNDKIKIKETRRFNVSCNEKLRSIRLTQERRDHLVMTGFDIIGEVY